ncbi:MAG: hypothetical protein MI924_29830 [Chloroflexales bacterium]|nr:hypothetical protein [Chloroflexales bacterium]
MRSQPCINPANRFRPERGRRLGELLEGEDALEQALGGDGTIALVHFNADSPAPQILGCALRKA